MKGAIKNFADTAEFISDQFYFKGTKDSLAAILDQVRGELLLYQKRSIPGKLPMIPEKGIVGTALVCGEMDRQKRKSKLALLYR